MLRQETHNNSVQPFLATKTFVLQPEKHLNHFLVVLRNVYKGFGSHKRTYLKIMYLGL